MAKDDGYVRFRCKECGQRLKLRKDREGGNVIQCPKCGAPVNVPLANIEQIAKSADMVETGQPGRLNVNTELLMKRLRGDEPKAAGPGSVGGAPTLREDKWSGSGSFSRMTELDQVVASISKIDQEAQGQIQRLYREQGISPEERAMQFEVIAGRRRDEIKKMLDNRLWSVGQDVRRLSAMRERLSREEADRLAALERAQEALVLYGRHICGLDMD